ncbi:MULTISPECIES: hypothetical protein [Bacillus amyloliquefaciens group]|uniref:hypothetical protein n=1 Tax=Bacillus amyloliquefaciens group TaxID=1938374 RepID=UPI001F0D39C7|nr:MULTISPECIES: hypothetical protein [Bacillus amyloliquefaciens group]MED2998597.1 hypothetical protein [Bacillus velezensis]UMU15087.1 hypothetical protein FOV14_09690 [Bacillus velezensis]WHM11725.1 hypothetical protein QLX65_10295 [Bacillus velezensis]WIX27433.1 hypothetical protein QQW99_09700 [Bacillus amyloliquefaciens]
MIILGIIATLATFVFITALIFIFFEKTKKIGKQIAPISLVLALSLFFIMGALNRESHETKTGDVTAATERTEEEPMYSEEEEDSDVRSVEDNQKEFNFSLEEFVQTFNEATRDIESDEDIESTGLSRINKDNIGDFELTEAKDGTIYTRELKTETDNSGGTFTLEAWYDEDHKFYRLHLSTSGSDNMASQIGLVNTLAVFHALGIDIKHVNDLLKSEQNTLEVFDGDYLVTLAKIPQMSLIINIEPK